MFDISYIFEDSEKNLKNTVWGDEINDDVVLNWLQGFTFSEFEPTAIVQQLNGPCSVLVPVQAYLLRELINCQQCLPNWRSPSVKCLDDHLVYSMAKILENLYEACGNLRKGIYVVCLKHCSNDSRIRNINNLQDLHVALTAENFTPSIHLIGFLFEHLDDFKSKFGVILLLYSVVLTKGIENIRSEGDDRSLPLIDPRTGHGSQNLLNLFLCGHAVGNVWDGSKDVAGLKMKGVPQQSTFGYLSIMEHFKLCNVGWNLKNPVFPIWVLGSERHLTLAFSEDKYLIESTNTPLAIAQKRFEEIDKEYNGFIPRSDLEAFLYGIKQKFDQSSLNAMLTALDPENLGIITRSAIMNYFFSDEISNAESDEFVLFHFNALPNSNVDKKVAYRQAKAKIVKTSLETPSNPIQPEINRCLRTKWPTIHLTWDSDPPPSLN